MNSGMLADSLIGPIPSNWTQTTLGEACALGGGNVQTGPFGSQLHASDYVPCGVPVVMPQDIGDNRLLTENIVKINESDAARLSRHHLIIGDIVYSRRGDVKRRALVREENEGWLCGTGCLRVRLGNGPVAPLWASYYLGHPAVQEWVSQHAIGATMPNLNTTILSQLPFIFPPSHVQEAVGGFLGALDDKIDLNRQMNQTLEQIAATLFKSWFVDFDPVRAKAEGRQPEGMDAETAAIFPDRLVDSEIGEIPEGWHVGLLGDIAEVVDCLHSKKPKRTVQGKPLIQLSNIRDDGLLDMTDPYLISEEDYARWISRIEVRQGDCVITNVGRIGAVAQIPPGQLAAIGRNMTAIRPRTSFPYPTWLIELLLSGWMRSEITNQTDSGTIMDALNVRSIPLLRMVRPTANVAGAFETIAAPLRRRMEFNLAESRTLAALRNSLLPHLLSSELRVPTDLIEEEPPAMLQPSDERLVQSAF